MEKNKIYLYFILLSLAACKQNTNSPAPTEPTAIEADVNKVPFDDLVNEFESVDRVIWQKPELVVQKLGDLTGKTIADIGAGSGYFSFRLLGKANKVVAVDIDKRFIQFMDSISTQLPVNLESRFEARLASETDPRLNTMECDGAIIVNTYCYIKNRVAYLKTLMKGLKPDSKLVIIDFKKKETTIGPPNEERLGMGEVEKDLLDAGFKSIVTDDTSLDFQYIVTATR